MNDRALGGLASPAGEMAAAASGRTFGRRRAAVLVSLLLLFAALWLATRPYYGVVQDARFYTVQALRLVQPSRFAGDLYFQFGATDQFSVFSHLYAPLVAALGVAAAALLGTVAAQLLWVSSALFLAFALFRQRWLALLSAAALIALPSGYSHYGYGEPFLTPRLFAEALTMIGLGLMLRGSSGWTFLPLVCALALHPPMAIPGLLVAAVYLAGRWPLWWLAIGAAAAAVAALAASDVPPFAGLLTQFDPAWFEIAKTRDAQWLVTAWSVEDDLRVAGTIGLATVALTLDAADRRLLGAALAVAVGGVALTLIGADLLHDVLVAQMLPWRALWLLTLLAQLYAVSAAIRLSRRAAAGALKPVFLTALVLLLASRLIPPLVLIASPLLAVAALLAVWQYRTRRRLPDLLTRGCRLLVAISCAAALVFAGEFIAVMSPLPNELLRRAGSFLIVLAALAMLVLLVAPRPTGRSIARRRLAFPTAAALAAVACLGWDVRTPWARFVEAPGGAPPELARLLPPGASVYWEGGVEMLWLRLRRSSYFSCAQGTGAVFFRPAAIAFEQRAEGLRTLHTVDFDDSECRGFASGGPADRTRDGLSRACANDRDLDYLVLIRPVAGVDAATWEAPVPYASVGRIDGRLAASETRRFYVYGCADLRRQ